MRAASNKKYYAYIDGLRAVSIFFVLAYHAWLPLFKSGSLGVDIFFVISGFLITSLLLKEFVETGAVSLRRFYVRRVFRIFPGLLTLLLVGTLFQRFWNEDFLGPEPVQSLIAGWGMFIDVFSFRQQSANAFNHLWSVHLEEQFYLFWSILLASMLRLKRLQSVFLEGFLLAVILGGLALRLGLVGIFGLWSPGLETVLRFFVLNRIDHLFFGCFLGYLVAAPSPTIWVRQFHGFLGKSCPWLNVGLAILILLTAQLPEAELSGAIYFVVVVSAALLLLRLRDDTESWLKTLLSSRVLVFIGKRSYSLYLWHWPTQEFVVRFGLHGLVKIGAYVTLTMVVAELSYTFVEKPFLRLKERYFEPVLTSSPRASG